MFHNRCVRAILGVTRYQQWQERLTTQALAERFGMTWTIPDVVTEHRLKWLGHVGRMDEGRLPKKLLFGELRKTRPNHGTKRRWRDLVSQDLKSIGAKDTWYKTCQDRKGWLDVCQEVVDKAAGNRRENRCAANIPSQGESYTCDCGRMFRRPGDLKRHQRFCQKPPASELPTAQDDNPRAPLS